MLFEKIVYGPIRSRRLGVSLGVNLMPLHDKLCSFNCIYCECGWNTPVQHPVLPTRAEVATALEAKLQDLQREAVTPDVITFSGNGEPTLHPDFEGIITDTCALRDRYFPSAKVSVLSNSTQLFREDVVRALLQVDNRILKLDSAIDATMRAIDKPVNPQLTVAEIMRRIAVFNGRFTLQTCFLRSSDGLIDNTTESELSAWYEVVRQLHPDAVMIYVIDRRTPQENLEKISPERMHEIAAPLLENGILVNVSC